MSSSPREQLLVHGERALIWLAASTASWSVVLAGEWLAQTQGRTSGWALVYVLSRALSLSAWFGLGVIALHAAALGLARLGRLGELALVGGLCAVALGPAYQLSVFLTAGAWIAERPYVRAVQAGLFAALLSGWLFAWALHALAAYPELLQRLVHGERSGRFLAAAFWLVGVGALGGLLLLLPGVLRAYLALGDRLLLPAWLVAGSLVYRACASDQRLAHLARPARSAALGVLLLSAGALAYTTRRPTSVSAVRAQTLAAGGFGALTEQRTHPGAPLGRFDFQRAWDTQCPAAARLPALALPERQRRNVILLSIDTVRRDAIGKRYGERAVAPNLEAFARRSVDFDRAVAPAPITLYSIGSVLTGHSVSQLLWLPEPPANLFKRTRKLFDRQQAMLPDWSVMRRGRLTSLIGQRVPTRYVPRSEDPSGPFIAELEKAREHDQRVFFWLHMVDPHAPYGAHRGFDFGDDKPDRYYGEVAFADARMGRVLARIEELGFFEDSLIVLFSDHGESLGEHGYYGHGVSVAARFSDVPLFVHYPGVAPRRSHAAVSLTSVSATVLHYLDRPIPATFTGCSLLLPDADLARCALPASTVFGLETATFDQVLERPVHTLHDLLHRQDEIERWQRFAPDVALTSSDHRYLFDLRTGDERLYDRTRDPDERNDLMAEREDLATELHEQLARFRRDEARRIVCQLREAKER